jgi:hypothetical protein
LSTNIPTPEPKGYAVTAAELRRIADALDTLPPGDEPPFVLMSILPEHTIGAVDAVALAVLGKTGDAQKGGDGWFHLARGEHGRTSVIVTVQTNIPGPPDPKDAEIELLRDELAKALEAARTAESHLGTNGAVAQAKPDTFGMELAEPDRHSPVTGRASVPDHVCDDECVRWTPLGAYKTCSRDGRASVPDSQTRPRCLPGCYEPTLDVDHVPGCPAGGA